MSYSPLSPSVPGCGQCNCHAAYACTVLASISLSLSLASQPAVSVVGEVKLLLLLAKMAVVFLQAQHVHILALHCVHVSAVLVGARLVVLYMSTSPHTCTCTCVT